jgi:cytochrome c553
MRILLFLPLAVPLFAADAGDFFERKIRPLFASQCLACHSSNRMGGLDLSDRSAAAKGGSSGAAWVAGKPESSLIIAAVEHRHERLKMPPAGKLTEAQIADLKAWVASGAIWPEHAKPVLPATVSEYVITEAQRNYWAFQAPKKVAPGPVKDSRWPKTEIDRYVLAAMESKGLRPVAKADKRTLIRRAYLDLTGLPPSPERVDAFVRDTSAGAFERVVDELLASPRYGERWGRYWLDVARYSDDELASQVEKPHPSSFRYRDWVIRAFNKDMPFNRFVKAQIAGDLMDGQELELAAGTGFFSLSPEQQDDRVDALTRGFLGLTVACAQCHDHKFDPIPTKDYYSLLGIFQSTRKHEYPLADAAVVKSYQAHADRLEARRKELTQLRHVQSRELARVLAHDTARYVAAAKGDPDPSLDPTIVARWRDYLARKKHNHSYLRLDPEKLQEKVIAVFDEKDRIDRENEIRLGSNPQRRDLSNADLLSLPHEDYYLWRDLFSSDRASVFYLKGEDIEPFLNAPLKARAEALKLEIRRLEDSMPAKYPFLQTIADDKPADIPIAIRGNKDNPGEIAPRRFLQILAKGERAPYREGSGRLELAEAIASPENPLTARVIVNRVWAWHFGRGLVATPSNFGKLGEAPSHPELLDYLAVAFIENGWSIKWLHREILRSETYQLSSQGDAARAEIDGDNRYLWRANLRRLDIETLRDAMLAVSGTLDLSMGGQARRLDESNKRRTVYGFVSRRDLDPTLLLFDFANPNATSERRVETSTPLQRLFLMNSRFIERRAEELACLTEAAGPDSKRITAAYRILFQREPEAEELKAGLEFLSSGPRAWRDYAQALLASNEFVYVP